MKKVLLSLLSLPLSLGLFSQTAVTLVNSSFETPDDSSKIQCTHQEITGNDTVQVPINDVTGFGWKIDNCSDAGREDPKKTPTDIDGNEIAGKDGKYFAFSHNTEGHIYQVTEAVAQAGVTYTFSGKTIWAWCSSDTSYSSVYISLAGDDVTARTIVAQDSFTFVKSLDLVDGKPTAWEDVSVSYTTTSSDIGKKIVVEFGNSTEVEDSWGYYYHDNFSLVKTGAVGIASITNKFSVFPNPSNGIVNIKTNGNVAKYDIYNTLGALVKSGNVTSQLDLTSMEKGTYFIKLNNKSSVEYHKVILK